MKKTLKISVLLLIILIVGFLASCSKDNSSSAHDWSDEPSVITENVITEEVIYEEVIR